MRRTKYTGITTITTIPVLQPSRRVHVFEDGSAAAQGLILTFPDDNYTTQVDAIGTTAMQPYIIGAQAALADGRGFLLGSPAQQGRAADNYCKITSKTGTAANVIVEEYD